MTHKIRNKLLLACLTFLAPLALAAPAASASTEPVSPERTTYEMVLTEFDPAVAEANGVAFTRRGDLYSFRDDTGNPVTVPGVGTPRAAQAQ